MQRREGSDNEASIYQPLPEITTLSNFEHRKGGGGGGGLEREVDVSIRGKLGCDWRNHWQGIVAALRGRTTQSHLHITIHRFSD